MDELWSRLELFLSRDVMERRYAYHHGERLEPDKAAEIISHLEQGRQYFRSAEQAGVLAGPLEQYYGVLAFSRAIALYRDAKAREGNLDKHHGLTARVPEDGHLEEITIRVMEGTFDQLLSASANRELAAIDLPHPATESGRHEFVRALQRPPVKTTFLLSDLLSRIPGVREHWERAIERPAHCYQGRVHMLMNTLTVSIWRGRFNLPEPDVLRAALGLSDTWIPRAPSTQGIEFDRRIAHGDVLSVLLPNVVEGGDLRQTIIEPFPDGWHLNELCALAAGSHVMSMLVRYYPTRWARLLAHEPGDSLLPVLQRLRGLIQTDFVKLLLWEFESPAMSEQAAQ
jgi:hypothetical protein